MIRGNKSIVIVIVKSNFKLFYFEYLLKIYPTVIYLHTYIHMYNMRIAYIIYAEYLMHDQKPTEITKLWSQIYSTEI